MKLLECFDKHGCDKGSKRHRYDRVYEPIFAPRRSDKLRILEIGIFGGASILAWRDYFPNAEVIGVDTFQRIASDSVPALRHERVSWWKLDSTVAAPAIEPVDIIIDDGSHKAVEQLATFANYFPLLKECGVYFIEDVTDCETVSRSLEHYVRHVGAAGEYLYEIHA